MDIIEPFKFVLAATEGTFTHYVLWFGIAAFALAGPFILVVFVGMVIRHAKERKNDKGFPGWRDYMPKDAHDDDEYYRNPRRRPGHSPGHRHHWR